MTLLSCVKTWRRERRPNGHSWCSDMGTIFRPDMEEDHHVLLPKLSVAYWAQLEAAKMEASINNFSLMLSSG